MTDPTPHQDTTHPNRRRAAPPPGQAARSWRVQLFRTGAKQKGHPPASYYFYGENAEADAKAHAQKLRSAADTRRVTIDPLPVQEGRGARSRRDQREEAP